MNKKPSAIRHMFIWSVISGTLLIGLFFAFISSSSNAQNVPEIFNSMASWLAAFGYGSIIGALLGVVSGLLLGGMMRQVPMPFTEADMYARRQLVFSIMFMVPILLCVFVLVLFGGIFTNPATLLIPSAIHATVSVFAAQHYMNRLQKWSKQYDLRKAKDSYADFDMMRLLDEEAKAEMQLSDEEASEHRTLES